MIHSNRRFVPKDLINEMLSNSQLKVFLLILLGAIGFFGVAGLNVMAAQYTVQVNDQIADCNILKNQVNSFTPEPVVDNLCGLQPPYIIGISLNHARRDTQDLRSIISNYQDLLREKRRVLIDEQKQLTQNLTIFGIESKLTLPSREDTLDFQVDFLNQQIATLARQHDTIESDYSRQINLYKYFLYVENRKDALNLSELITTKQDIKGRYTEIKNQNNLWTSQSKMIEVNKDLLEYVILSPQEFIDEADQITLPNPTGSIYYSVITGIKEIDTAIIDIAWERGYRPRISINESELESVQDQKLSPEVTPWLMAMKADAQKVGIGMVLTSGYRSELIQKALFAARLRDQAFASLGRELTAADARTSTGTFIINKTLALTAPPGYSKHHTGLTVDIGYDFGPNQRATAFEETPAFAWLSENNYYNAKRFGFIPSYPKNADQIGPEPEAWEYVWVGKQSLQ